MTKSIIPRGQLWQHLVLARLSW